jgi:FkbM family methyltransferase
MNATTIRKSVGALPLTRAVTDWEPVGHAIATAVCARVLTQPLRFGACELRGARGPRSYTLRDSGITIFVRHQTADIAVIAEIFVDRVYEPPGPVAAVLGGLGRPPRIVDLGANIGLFGAFALGRWRGATVDGFEPDPANAELHQLALACAHGQAWRLTEAAADCGAGVMAFVGERFSASAAASAEELGGDAHSNVRAVDVLPAMNDADLVKMDIEGGEWSILSDPRFTELSARALVLEYHAHLAPTADPRAAAHGFLTSAGYEVIEVPLTGATAGQGMLWAWRTAA